MSYRKKKKWSDGMSEKQLDIRRRRAEDWNEENKERVLENWDRYYSTNRKRIARKRRKKLQHPFKGRRIRRQERLASRAFRKRNPWYDSWQMAKGRCDNIRNVAFLEFGGRGIRCELSKADMIFLWKRDRGDGLRVPSLERKDRDGHYVLENCRFVERRDNLDRRKKLRARGRIRDLLAKGGKWPWPSK